MSDVQISLIGKIQALSPIVHGEPPEEGARRTNVTPIRRIPYVMPDGSIALMPVVSGNSIRGMVRRRFIARTLRVLGTTSLDSDIAYFLLAGGATDQGTASIGSPEFREQLCAELPFIDLLGGSLHACFIPGKLRVDFIMPLTREVYANNPVAWRYFGLKEEELPPTRELLAAIDSNPIRLTRCDDTADGTAEEAEGAEEAAGEEEKGQAKKSSRRHIYIAYAIPQNTLLIHGFGLERSRQETADAFWAFVDCFLEKPTVGGWSAKGFGKIYAEYHDESTGEAVNVKEKSEAYWNQLARNKDRMVEYLTERLPAEVQARLRAAQEKKNRRQKEKEN